MKKFLSILAAAVTLLAAPGLWGATPAPQARVTLVERNAAPGAQTSAAPSVVRKSLPGQPDREAWQFSLPASLGTPATEQVPVAFHRKTTLTGIEATNDFHVVGGSCRQGVLYNEGDTCAVVVSFEPKGPGQRAGLLRFSAAGAAHPDVVGLQGLSKGASISFVPALITTLPQSMPSNSPLLYQAGDVLVDQGDNLYVSDFQGAPGKGGMIYMMDSSGNLSAVAGGGTSPVVDTNDASQGLQTLLGKPLGLAADSFLTVYIADTTTNSVDMLFDGYVAAFAGLGKTAASGCNPTNKCHVLDVQLQAPDWVNVDAAGNVDLTDETGFYQVPASPGTSPIQLTINNLASAGPLAVQNPFGVDLLGNIYGPDLWEAPHMCAILGENPASLYNWKAIGNGICGSSGNNVKAQNAEIGSTISGYAFDAAGDMYVADAANNLLRRVDTYNGLLRNVAGNVAASALPGAGYTGDYGPATDATLSAAKGVAADSNGVLYTASVDTGIATGGVTTLPNYVIRQIGPDGQRNFPTTLVGKQSQVMTILLTNTGNDDLVVSNQIMGGANPGDFVEDPNTTSCSWGAALKSGQSCQFGFSCYPTAPGLRTADITFADNTATFQNRMHLKCYGLAGTTTPIITVQTPIAGAIFPAGSTVPAQVVVDNQIAQYPTPPTGTVTLSVTKAGTNTVVASGQNLPVVSIPNTSRAWFAIPYQFAGLAPGNYLVTAYYSGDSLGAAATSTQVAFSVVLATPNVTISSPAASASFLPGTVNATVVVANAGTPPAAGAAPTGTITLTVLPAGGGSSLTFNGTLVQGNSGSSSVTIPMTNLGVASWSVSAAYFGDTLNAAANSSSIAFKVVQLTPKVTISTPPANFSFVPGTVIPTTVTVSNTGLTPADPSAPTGAVGLTFTNTTTSVIVQGGQQMLTPGSNGTSSFTYANPVPSLTAGTWTVVATYLGDTADALATSAPATFTVQQDTPAVTIGSPSATLYTYGTAFPFTAQVSNYGKSPANPNAPTGTVTFVLQTGSTKTTNLPTPLVAGSGGVSTATIASPGTLKAGIYTLTATYNGDTSNAPASASFTFTIGQAIPAIVWATPNAIYTGTALSATQLNAKAMFNNVTVPGTYVYTPPAGTVESSAATVTLTVKFTPTDTVDFAQASGSVKLLVQSHVNIVTGTKLASTLNPAPRGKAITLSASVKPVSGSTLPTGVVTLSENGKAVATGSLASGAARLTLTGLAPGKHVLTASYGGDKQHAASASEPLTQVVVNVGPAATPGQSNGGIE